MSNFHVPTDEQVQAALLRIPTYQLRRVFYEGLENPHWVRPLSDAGAFANPPEPEETADGHVRDTFWPEISYLTRIAPQAPGEVVEVLLKLESSKNAWVRRAAFEIGSLIPPDSSARLEPLIKAWVPSDVGWRTDSRSLVSLAINLLEGGHPKLGRWLANSLFQPYEGGETTSVRKPKVRLEDYWYEEQLPLMISALGENRLQALIGWLRAYLTASGHATKDHDFSAMDRASIAARSSTTARPENALIDAIRDVAVVEMRKQPVDTVDTLLRGNIGLLRKIAMYVAAEAIRQELGAGGSASALVEAARPLLEDKESDDSYLRNEYARLVQAVAQASSSATDVVSVFLDDAFVAHLELSRERLDQPGDYSDEQWEEHLLDRARRYRHRWLSAIGHDALPPTLRAELASLDETKGAIDNPMEPEGQVTSWTGPNPHTSQDEMARMAPAELVAHLSSWHDDGDGWGPEPSHEGQGRALAGLLTTSPRALTGVSNLGERLRPTYLRAVLQGWEAAIKADLELEWNQVADLTEYVLGRQLATPFPVEGGDFDDDKDHSGAKRAAVGLLEELLKERGSRAYSDALEERFARMLIERSADEDSWTAYDTYEHGGSGWDPLNMSLNWQWPSRIRALIVAAASSIKASWRDDALAEIEREMSRVDRHGAGRAALGEGLGTMLNIAPEWVQARLEAMVGSAERISTEQQVVLTTAMATHRYNRTMYELLSPAMLAAIDVGDALVAGWKGESAPLTRIGEWAIDALLYGHVTVDDQVFEAFFARTSPAVRGDAMAKVAWVFFQAMNVDDEIRDRFAALWDSRIQHVRDHLADSKELEGFFWLAKSNSFSPEWWLPRLKAALELEPSIATERYMIGKELAHGSSSEPGAALEVLRLILGGRGESSRAAYDLSRHAIPIVIANALSSPDSELQTRAAAYMNQLGAEGNLDLEDEVSAVLEGKVSVDDVED